MKYNLTQDKYIYSEVLQPSFTSDLILSANSGVTQDPCLSIYEKLLLKAELLSSSMFKSKLFCLFFFSCKIYYSRVLYSIFPIE